MRKYWKALVNIVIAIVMVVLVLWLVPKFLWFFLPFVVGWIISLIAAPLVKFFEEKLKIRRKAGSAFVIVAVIAVVVLVLYGICARLAEEVMGLMNAAACYVEECRNGF